MRKLALLTLALALAAAACGDDATTSTTGSAATSEPSTTSAATTTAATTTTASSTTTVTTVDAAAARVAAAMEYAGTYRGEWRNTTFGSTGPIDTEFSVDAATALATLTLDLGGNVFGATDPAPLVAEFDLSGEGPYEGTNDVFGDFTVEVDAAGHLALIAPAVPGVGDRTMTIEGDLTDDGFTGTYTIAGLAEGTFAATRT